MWGVSRM